MKALIEKLITTPGPSGYETQIRELVRAEIESFADEIQVDLVWGAKNYDRRTHRRDRHHRHAYRRERICAL